MSLLDFLSKTDSVDLYNFPMYENKISYSEYKIKAICEDPFVKNKFDNRVKIDLKENIVYLDYEFSENIIKPIINNKFLYSDPLKRICFLFIEFKKQENSDVFDKYFEEIIDNFDSLKQDRNLFVSEKINEENVLHLNLKYIFECVEDYIDLMKEQNKNLLKDKFLIKILEFIQNNIDDSFQYIEDELLVFIQKFEELKKVDDLNFIKIIDKLLSENFEKYYKELDWYLEFSPAEGKTCFVGNIIKLIKDNIELDKELIENYLNNRYLSINTNNYFDSVSNNITDILQKPSSYKCILSPLSNNLNNKDISFEKLEAARWLEFLKPGGKIIVNTQEIDPMPVITGAAEYPKEILEKITAKGVCVIPVDALKLAEEAGSSKAVNIVLMGVLSHFMHFTDDVWEEALKQCVPQKFLGLNQKAFALGKELSKSME